MKQFGWKCQQFQQQPDWPASRSFPANLTKVLSARRRSGFIPDRRKQISATADGPDHGWLGRIDLDLASNSHDAQIDGAIEGFRVTRVREFQQTFARQYPFGICGENLEQAEFGCGQRMLIALVVT